MEQQGHKILWLPAYSPDLNPIKWKTQVDVLIIFFESCMNNKAV
ncbi:hypothetical protein H2787_02375 [Acinetobacter baumannii]|nr:hypothetical protein H2787_02375 [Acinetobacter baumannii]